MKTNLEPFRKWFGFSRRERRSSFMLLLIILITILIRYLTPESAMTIEDLSSLYVLQEKATGSTADTIPAIVRGSAYRTDGTLYDEVRAKRVYGSHNRGAAASVGSYQSKSELIELNSADSALLESLPGIGPVLSVRTIKYRELLGGFSTISQMREVYGLSEETYTLIKGMIRADTLKIRKIKVNQADYGQLIRHPYLERYEVSAILRYRELSGNITKLGDLTGNKLLDAEKAAKLGPYLDFD